MLARVFATVVALLFAITAFLGYGEGSAGPLNPFGLLFLGIAAFLWDEWIIITGEFSPGLFDGLLGRGKDHYRAKDDHYRSDGSQHYQEPEDH
ncbi:MAG: hypothetical protein ACREE4_05625 [Stellaceae bacterium]